MSQCSQTLAPSISEGSFGGSTSASWLQTSNETPKPSGSMRTPDSAPELASRTCGMRAGKWLPPTRQKRSTRHVFQQRLHSRGCRCSVHASLQLQGSHTGGRRCFPHKVEAKLPSLKPSSSPGPDSIHPRVLRESASVLAGPLSELFRKSIDGAKLPTEWKVGEVIPIYKKGDRQSPASYRPVSLTAIPSKVLESSVRDHLLHHFSSAGMSHDAQHGFLPESSCSSQLIEAMEDWSAAVEDGYPLDVAYLDLVKRSTLCHI